MTDKTLFQERLAELGRLARTKDNRLGTEEVSSFFEELNLQEEQYQLLYEYLAAQRITVEGYVPAKEAGQKEQTGEQLPYTEEEQAFLRLYQEDLKNLKKLESEELEQLYRELRESGAQMAKARIMEQMLPAVLELAKKFRGRGLPLGDLVQEGNIGLMLALETLSMDGAEPAEIGADAYLHREIRRAIGQAIEEQTSKQQADELLVHKINDLSDSIRGLTDELERKVSVEELSVYMDMPVEEIEEILKLAGESIELEEQKEEG